MEEIKISGFINKDNDLYKFVVNDESEENQESCNESESQQQELIISGTPGNFVKIGSNGSSLVGSDENKDSFALKNHNHDEEYALLEHFHDQYLTQQDIINKADVANVPTRVSELENDSGYLTRHQDISGKVNKVSGTINNFVAFADSNGTIKDSGVSAASFALNNHNHDTSYATKNHKHSIESIVNLDLTPTENSDNLVTSGGIYTALQGVSGESSITIDSSITQGGTNPVAGGAIYAAFDNKISKKGTGYENYIAFFDANGDLKKTSVNNSTYALSSTVNGLLSRITFLESKIAELTKNKYTGSNLSYNYTITQNHADYEKLISNLPAGTYTSSAVVTGVPSTPSELNGTCLVFVSPGSVISPAIDNRLYGTGSDSDIILIANWGEEVTSLVAADVYVVCITKSYASQLRNQQWSSVEYNSSGTINISDIKIQDMSES